MVNKTKYMYDKYTSLYSYCVANGYDYVKIVQRINHGADVQKAVEDYKNNANNKTKLFYKGVPLRQYCEEHGIDYNLVITRMTRGRSLEDSIEFYDMRYDPDNLEI